MQKTRFICKFLPTSVLLNPDPHYHYGYGSRTAKPMRIRYLVTYRRYHTVRYGSEQSSTNIKSVTYNLADTWWCIFPLPPALQRPVSRSPRGKPGFRIRIRIRINLSCWIRIRIQIADPDPDPGGQKFSKKIEKSTEFSCFEVLDVLFWGLKASPVAWASFMEA
jgi:hypothetical protein